MLIFLIDLRRWFIKSLKNVFGYSQPSGGMNKWKNNYLRSK
jgi:hypothetical protein